MIGWDPFPTPPRSSSMATMKVIRPSGTTLRGLSLTHTIWSTKLLQLSAKGEFWRSMECSFIFQAKFPQQIPIMTQYLRILTFSFAIVPSTVSSMEIKDVTYFETNAPPFRNREAVDWSSSSAVIFILLTELLKGRDDLMTSHLSMLQIALRVGEKSSILRLSWTGLPWIWFVTLNSLDIHHIVQCYIITMLNTALCATLG